MTVCIHQPNLFPWIGFFHKVFESDIFVSLDDVQLARNSFTRRVQIRANEKNDELSYLILPLVKHHQLTDINKIFVDSTQLWQERMLNQIRNTYKNAPNFKIFFQELENWLSDTKTLARLDEVNFFLIKKIFNYVPIRPKTILKSSELGIEGFHSSDYILEICKKLKANVYLSGIGSKNYLIENDFANNNLELKYIDFRKLHTLYPIQQHQGKQHIAGLSIIDVLMNVSKETFLQHLESLNSKKGN